MAEKTVEKYLKADIDDGIFEFSVQEIISLYASVLEELKKDESSEAMNEKKQTVFKSIVLRLMRSESIFVAYHVMTGYPYIDVKGNAWVFSEKQFSRDAHHHYTEAGIPLTMKEFKGQEIVEEIFELDRIGAGRIIIDNGQRSVPVMLHDIMTAMDISEPPAAVHPELMLNILSYMELSYASDGKHPALPEGRKEITRLISEAHLLIPAKLEKHLEDGEVLHVTTETTSQLALVNPTGRGKGLLAAFTDWREFTKLYSKDEWNAVVFDYATLQHAASQVDGFMINPSGVMFVIPNE